MKRVFAVLGICFVMVSAGLVGRYIGQPNFEVPVPKIEVPFVPATPVVVQPSPVPAPKPPMDPVVAMDGHNRKLSLRLSTIARETAQSMSNSNRLYHTRLQPHTATHGVMRENVAFSSGIAVDWGKAYDLWRTSPPHQENIDKGGEYLGWATVSNGFNTYYVVLYAELP